MIEISNEVIKVFEYLGDKIGIAIDWSSENIIPYALEICNKYITWEICTSITWIIIALIFCFIPFCMCLKGFVKQLKNEDVDGDVVFACMFFGALTLALFVMITGKQIFDIIKGAVFPELMLYECAERILR